MKKITLFLTLISLSSTMYAQNICNKEKGAKVIRGPYETNHFFDNWFIGAGAGINIYQGNSDSHQKLGKRTSTALDFSVGKWALPEFGVRIQYSGLKAKGSTNFESIYATKSLGDGYYNEKFNVSNLHTDFLWNISNTISGYKDNRLWDIIPYVGVGWVRSWNKTSNLNEYATSVGILNTVRLCDFLDLTIEGRHMFANNRLDGVNCGYRYDKMSSVTVGISFKLGKRSFKRVVTPNYSRYNKRIAELQAISTGLAKELEKCKNHDK